MNKKQNTLGTRSFSRKKAVFFVVVFCVLVCSYLVATNALKWFPFESRSTLTSGDNPTSAEQLKAGSVTKSASTQDGKTSGSDQPAAPVVQSDGKELVQVDITSVNKIDSITRVGVLISFLDQSGACTLTVTSASGGVLYSASVGVQALSNSSTCKGFDIPNSSLTEAKYRITVDYASDKKYGVAHYEQP